MSSPLRIAILECDEFVEEVKEKCGSLRNLYTRFLENSALKLEESGLYKRPDIKFSYYDVVQKQEYPDIGNIDAVLLTGSRYDSFTSGLNNWILKLVDFIKAILQDQRRVRIMAVCFGHQVIARALGAMPERSDAGWEVSVTPLSLTERGKQVFGQDSLVLHQMHRDVVPYYPSFVEKLGHSKICEVQGMYVKNRIITLQGHPEYNEKIANILLDRRRGTLMDDTTYQDGKKRANDSHDGLTVGFAFLRFLLEE